MTRKDYIEIAAAVMRAWNSCDTDDERAGVRAVAQSLADLLSGHSSQFDVALFMRNCGIRD